MAEFIKFKSYSVGRLLLHNNRIQGDGIQHSNEDIDDERTMYNYHLKKGTADDVKKRLSEVFSLKRKDATVLGEMVVTLPKNVKKEDEREFFEAVYDFYSQDFGEKNIVNAVVHKDESQPHMHLDFVPVVKNENEYSYRGKCYVENWKKEHNGEFPTEKLCCKDLITREYLSDMHPRLSEFVKERLGYEVDILNGATENGNKSVLQLKSETLEKEIKEKEKKCAFLSNEINQMITVAKQHGISENDIGLYPLMQKIDDLENQNIVLKKIIARQNYTWKSDELKEMQAKAYKLVKSMSVNVYDGSLVNADIEKNGVVVIELPDQMPRPSPQQKLIDNDEDLCRQMKFVQSSGRQIASRNSRTSDRIYIFIKTDSEKQTIENLLALERQFRELDLENRKVYMDRMESDTYDLARSILIKDNINALYFTNRKSDSQKVKENEQEKTKA